MTTAIAYPVRSPRWELFYSGANIFASISRMVISVTYEDHGYRTSDDCELKLEDREKRWQGPWFPVRGDIVSLSIGYDGEPLLDCGDFTIDEVELAGAPDVVHMRCLAAYVIAKDLRTPNTTGYEGQTLTQIAGTIAAKHGLELVAAAVDPDVTFQRVTQKQETDLAFLRRLSREHNYDFAVRGPQLVFYSRPKLEQTAPVLTIHRTDVERFQFKARTQQIYKACEVSYQDPVTKKLITQRAGEDDAESDDTIKCQTRCENAQQAMLKAQATLHDRNMLDAIGTLTLPGTIRLIAGNNITVDGFGNFNGKYHIDKSRHSLSRDRGYTTEVEIRRVAG